MRHLIISCIIAIATCTCVQAQSVYDDLAPAPKEQKLTKEEKKAQKEKEKRLQAMTDSVNYKFAAAALRTGHFALTANRVQLGNTGYTETCLNENTNFVYQDGNEAVVQIAFDGADPGLNGFGGVTCKGNVSGVKFSEDKKGNLQYEFSVMGLNINAQVLITVYAGTNRATAYVNPTFASSNWSVTLYGELVPYKQDGKLQTGME